MEDDEEEFEAIISFTDMLQKAFPPKVKLFLFEYFGDNLLDIEPETFLEIEALIVNNIDNNACDIPEILYRYRTITDEDEFDEALDSFVPDNKPINWPKTKEWFYRNYNEADDDDQFYKDSYSIDLTEDIEKNIIRKVHEVIDNTQKFALFMRAGFKVLNREVHLFLENNTSFDLAILSAEGYIALQNSIDMFVTILLEDLYSIMSDK